MKSIFLKQDLNTNYSTKKRNLSIEEFSKRLPYFNMLKNDKNNNRNEKGKKNLINKRPNKSNKIILEEEKEDFFINNKGILLNEILLGDPNIVNNHLRDFKYTPLKIFELIRDSEKYRDVDLTIQYSQLNDKKLSINFQATIFLKNLLLKLKDLETQKENPEINVILI